jgi:hypothetical protein
MNTVPEVHRRRDFFGARGPSKILLVVAATVAICIIVLMLPLKVPYTVKTFGRLQPIQRWMVTSGANGQLLTSLINYKTGLADGYRASQFAREGTIKFSFHPRILAGDYVRAGDTVATIYSSGTEERVADLQGQLKVMRATLTADVTGEKESIIRQYEAVVAHAEEKAANQRRITERLQTLYQRQLATQQEFEIAESESRVLDADVDIAKAQLKAARTGVKPESTELIEAKLATLGDDLSAVHERQESFCLFSPISGRISRTYSADTLLVVSDTTAYVVLIPITISDVSYVVPGQLVRITVGRKDDQVDGRLLLLDTQTHQLKGRQIQIGTALIEQTSMDLPLGMISPCVVQCGSVTPLEYVKRVIEGM